MNATDHPTDRLEAKGTDQFHGPVRHTPSDQGGPVDGPVRTTYLRMYGPVPLSMSGPVQRTIQNQPPGEATA